MGVASQSSLESIWTLRNITKQPVIFIVPTWEDLSFPTARDIVCISRRKMSPCFILIGSITDVSFPIRYVKASHHVFAPQAFLIAMENWIPIISLITCDQIYHIEVTYYSCFFPQKLRRKSRFNVSIVNLFCLLRSKPRLEFIRFARFTIFRSEGDLVDVFTYYLTVFPIFNSFCFKVKSLCTNWFSVEFTM